MSSSEDMIVKENEAKELAIKKFMKEENCSKSTAEKYVNKLTKEEIAELIDWPAPGGAYSTW